MKNQPALPFDGPDAPQHPPATRASGGAPKSLKSERPPAPDDTKMDVRIVRSRRRKKTVGAHVVDGIVEVIVPMWMSRSEAERFAEQMRQRFERKRASSDLDLVARARALSRTYDFPTAASVRWVTNQNSRWGSCTPADGAIRLSDRLKKTPSWVIDYVLVHELAHLRHPDHSAAFWAAVNRYPKTERARGFLEGMGFAEDDPTGSDGSERSDDTGGGDLVDGR